MISGVISETIYIQFRSLMALPAIGNNTFVLYSSCVYILVGLNVSVVISFRVYLIYMVSYPSHNTLNNESVISAAQSVQELIIPKASSYTTIVWNSSVQARDKHTHTHAHAYNT